MADNQFIYADVGTLIKTFNGASQAWEADIDCPNGASYLAGRDANHFYYMNIGNKLTRMSKTSPFAEEVSDIEINYIYTRKFIVDNNDNYVYWVHQGNLRRVPKDNFQNSAVQTLSIAYADSLTANGCYIIPYRSITATVIEVIDRESFTIVKTIQPSSYYGGYVYNGTSGSGYGFKFGFRAVAATGGYLVYPPEGGEPQLYEGYIYLASTSDLGVEFIALSDLRSWYHDIEGMNNGGQYIDIDDDTSINDNVGCVYLMSQNEDLSADKVYCVRKMSLNLAQTVTLPTKGAGLMRATASGVYVSKLGETGIHHLSVDEGFISTISTANAVSALAVGDRVPIPNTPVYINYDDNEKFKFSKNPYPDSVSYPEPECKVNYLVIGKINE